MKTLRTLTGAVFLTITLGGHLTMAANYLYQTPGCYEEGGDLLFKIRGFYANVSSKPKNFPGRFAAVEKPGSLVSVSYGGDAGVTYFFTNNLAAELSVGVGLLKVKKSALAKAATSMGNAAVSSEKNNDIYMIPITALAQYHIAPFGAIRPYIGAGYHGTYMYTESKSIKPTSGHGFAAQVGVDFVIKDDSFFTLDLRQYLLQTNVNFKKSFPGLNDDVKSKVKWNPLIVSVGYGIKF